MQPALRLQLATAGALLLALVLGWQIASGNYLLALAGAGLLLLIALEWFGAPLPEALVVGFLLAGYLIGNRGFAQLSLVGNAPLFLGEIGLGLGVGFLVVRGAIARRVPVEKDLFNAAAAAWIAVGCLRIWHDFGTWGAAAIRDFATIYYAGFFFITQAAMRHPGSAQWIRGCMTFGCIVLPLVSLLYNLAPDFFLETLTFRGVPLIYQKNDLVATFLFSASFFLLSRPAGRRPWVKLSAVASLFAGLAWLSRAGMLGLLVVTGGWSWARLWRPLKLLGVAALIGVFGVGLDAAVGSRQFTDTKAYAVYEHVVSMFDFEGTRVYRSEESADSGANNQFRQIWWKSVAEETWRANPLLGLGFGHNLAEGFVSAYGLRADDSFSARSPHSIVFTMIGRLGAVGLAAVLFVAAALGMGMHSLLSAVRRPAPGVDRAAALDALGWWSVACVIFISSCFGVVLEGPMGAVLFWSALGAGNFERLRALSPDGGTAHSPAAHNPS